MSPHSLTSLRRDRLRVWREKRSKFIYFLHVVRQVHPTTLPSLSALKPDKGVRWCVKFCVVKKKSRRQRESAGRDEKCFHYFTQNFGAAAGEWRNVRAANDTKADARRSTKKTWRKNFLWWFIERFFSSWTISVRKKNLIKHFCRFRSSQQNANLFSSFLPPSLLLALSQNCFFFSARRKHEQSLLCMSETAARRAKGKAFCSLKMNDKRFVYNANGFRLYSRDFHLKCADFQFRSF